MQKRGENCRRCSTESSSNLNSKESLIHQIKRPQSYMSKKFEDLYNESNKLKNRRSKIIKQAQQEKTMKQLSACTFKPAINQAHEYFVSPDPFLKRETDWKKNLSKKIDSKRQQKQLAEKKKLTFQPKISPSPNLTNQVSHTMHGMKKSTVNSTYSSNYNKFSHANKSYKVIHAEHKKFKQLTKSTIIQPFQHRKNQHSAIQQPHSYFNHPNLTSSSLKKTQTMEQNYQSKSQNPEQEIFSQQLHSSGNDQESKLMGASIEVKIVEEVQHKITVPTDQQNTTINIDNFGEEDNLYSDPPQQFVQIQETNQNGIL